MSPRLARLIGNVGSAGYILREIAGQYPRVLDACADEKLTCRLSAHAR
jgi:hypothetical protein